MGNPPSSGDALFRTLIAAKNARFPESFQPPAIGPDFYPKFGQSLAVIWWRKWGHFGDTWVARDFPGILGVAGSPPSPEDAIFRTLIADTNSQLLASFQPPARGPDFYPKFGQPLALIRWRKRGHFGDTWIAHDPPKILGQSWAISHRARRLYFEL